jgi:methylmalonyl-CoA mutase, C-terminal domain
MVEMGIKMNSTKRIIKVILGKSSLDGHWRGLQAVATALRNSGMEVVYAGTMASDALIRVAIQESADVIGLNVGASYEQVEELIKKMKKNEIDNLLLIVGGVIPLADVPKLKKMGVDGVFPPGSKLKEIVKFVSENVS